MIVPTSPNATVGPGGNKPLGHLLSIKEIAGACQLSEKAVRRAIDDGELPAVKLRSRLRITPQDFETWIASSRRKPQQERTRPAPRRSLRAPAGIFRSLIHGESDNGATR